MLRLVFTADFSAVVPSNVNIMNHLFVSLDLACCLCLVFTADFCAGVPSNVNIVNILFVSFEVTC